MLVAESRMVMGKAHVFHVGSLSYNIISRQIYSIIVILILSQIVLCNKDYFRSCL